MANCSNTHVELVRDQGPRPYEAPHGSKAWPALCTLLRNGKQLEPKTFHHFKVHGLQDVVLEYCDASCHVSVRRT